MELHFLKNSVIIISRKVGVKTREKKRVINDGEGSLWDRVSDGKRVFLRSFFRRAKPQTACARLFAE